MTIADVRFGAMVITAKGRIHTFDSIECLAAYVAALASSDRPRGVYVANHEHPSQWVDVSQATFLHQSQLRSPMERDLAAFPREADRAALLKRFGGEAITWSDVLALTQSPISTSGTRSRERTHGTARHNGARTN